LDMLNEKMIMTGSNVVERGRLKELDRKDAQKRPDGIDMKSLGLSQKDAQFRNKWRRRIKGATSKPRYTWKMVCVCVFVCVVHIQNVDNTIGLYSSICI